MSGKMRGFFLIVFLGSFKFLKSQTILMNAAFRKPVSANITCGSPAENYYTIHERDKFSNQRTTLTCDASVPSNSHPPSYLVDGSMATFWQSTAWKTAEQANAYIQIDFQQRFFARAIKFTFGDHRRPGAIKISRSINDGILFTPYHYLVSSPESTQCQEVFGLKHYSKSTEIDRVDRVLCQHYDKRIPLDYNETIEVDLNRRSKGVQNGEFTSEVQAWMSVTNLHFAFSKMYLAFDMISYKFNHYTAREIEFFARCDCSGHGDGNVCPQEEATKLRSCVCANNTCGMNCEKCCPLYNQKPWTAGSKAPWDIDTSVSCEACNCHNHSSSCVYNQTVNDLKLSLDINGNKDGGGVCQDCQNYTRGINCEKCKEFYFRPRGRDQSREDACQACGCDARGTKNVNTLSFLDCVSDETELSQHPGKEPGDCYCKANVMGRKCDTCKPTYYNLTKGNSDGCIECQCHQPGTRNATRTCDLVGQCHCKPNVDLRDCSQCKYGFYDLQNSTIAGCKSCGCDEGGTYPQDMCSKVTGQCQCRPNVIRRDCTKPAIGYYYPDLHSIRAEKDPYTNASNTLSVRLYIPKTADYRLHVRKYPDNMVTETSIKQIESNTGVNNTALQTCTTRGFCKFTAGNYSINITVDSGILLKYLAAIPSDYFESNIIGPERHVQFQEKCNVSSNKMRADPVCLRTAFSLTTAFFNGTLPCNCNSVGSNSTNCSEYEGQCECKPGVEGRDCGRCKPGYYNMTSEGCQPCECKGDNKVCHPFTGVCDCPANTVGDKCDPCQCNNNTNKCLRTGECQDCQHKTAGFSCEKCTDAFYGDALTQQCRSCACDEGGTYPKNTCNRMTGQCQCRSHVTSRTCIKPVRDYYYPDLHYIRGEKDPYTKATNNFYTMVQFPKNTNYTLALRKSAGIYLTASDVISIETNTGINSSLLRACIEGRNYCSIPAGNYSVNVTVKNELTVDRIVFIPKAFLVEKDIIGEQRYDAFNFNCQVMTNKMTAGNEKLCQSNIFSLTVAFLNGSLPCNCNSVGSISTNCSEYAGQCECKPGVEGRDCGRCIPGYYNMTSEGCRPCQCNGANNICHPFTGVCDCPANTVGPTCEACQCNNNTNKCLRTGECQDCQHNTTGFSCDNCVNMTYGNASARQCRACDCNSTGSLGDYCNIVTGQCMCKPKITGQACDVCQNNSYGFSSSGCTGCGCNVYGSMSQQCNESGHCQCKAGANGQKCSECTSGYYGLPSKPCATCNCNVTGTVTETVCANDAIGQCECKPGVAGRACDRCDKYYTNFTDQGCTACPECVLKMAKTVQSIVGRVNTTNDKRALVDSLAQLHSPLANIEKMEGQTPATSAAFTSRLTTAQEVYQRLYNVDLPHANSSYSSVHSQNNDYMATAPNVSSNLASHINRTKDIHSKTVNAEALARDLDALLQNLIKTFTAHVNHGTQIVRLANESVTRHMVRNFVPHNNTVDMNLKDADNLTAFVAMVAKKLVNQTSVSSDLNVQVKNSRENLAELVMGWSTTHAQFISRIESIRNQFSGIHDVVRQTQMILSMEMQRLNEVKPVHNNSKQILNDTSTTIQSALTSFELYKAMITEVSGEVQISMHKYDFAGKWFGMKILAARNLSPRDLVSGKADPYLLISLIPGDHGTRKSNVKTGTLNPTWEEYEQIFKFNIAHEQLKKSRLRIQVFDSDPGKDDDFMGEVYIDLSAVGDQTITKWYPLRAEDVSQLESGNFKSNAGGLVDVTNLLQALKDKAVTILSTVHARLLAAHKNAQLMKNQSEAMKHEFSAVNSHGETAVQAIQRYIEIERLINNSITTLTGAQNTIVNITSQLNRLSASALITMARQEKLKATTLYDNFVKRNLSQNGVAHVEHYLTQLNASLQDVVPQWYQAYSHYPALIEAAARLKHGAKDALPAYQSIKEAQGKCIAHEQAVTRTVNEVNMVEGQVNSIVEKITYIQTAPERQSRLIQETYQHLNNASMKMNQSASHMENATSHDKVLTVQQQNISTSLNSVEKKLNALKKRLSLLELGLAIKGKGVANYRLPRATVGSPKQNDVTLTVRTNSSDGDLIKMAGKMVDSQKTGIYITLKDGYVQAKYNVGKGDITLTNPVRINDNQWTNIHYTREGTMAALSVENPTQSRTVVHSSDEYNTAIEYTQDGIISIGQPSNTRKRRTINLSSSNKVIFSNCKVDQSPVYFWDYQSISDACELALPQHPNFYYPDSGQAATFGSAHAWTEKVTTHGSYLEKEFSFRTFKSDGVLMTTYYGDRVELLIYLKSGRVHAQVRNGTKAFDVVQTKRSSYNNGDWVQLAFVLHEKTTVLNVTYKNVVDFNESATKILSTGYSLKGTHMSIGSIAANTSMANVPVKEPFIGDIKDVKNSIPDVKIIQDLSLKQAIRVKGVYTNDVIAGKVEPGAARFYGYTKETNACSYVKVNNTESNTSSLSFTFKTSKKSALLMYSQTTVGNKSVVLYIALWHGNLQINHHDSGSGETKPYQSTGITFADNIWREVFINSSAEGYSLYVNNYLVHSGWFGNSRDTPFRLNNPVYIGGVEPNTNIPLKTAVTACFEGAMKNVKFDDTSIDLFSQESVNVVNGGVPPSKPPPPPPPTCGVSTGSIQYSTDKALVGFVSGFAGGSNKQSYMQISNDIDFSDVFMWALEFRPLSSNGLVFYVADNLTHPGRFMSLELINGKIKFQINLNPGLIDMITVNDYVNVQRSSAFVKISGIHISSTNFGAILISDTKEYHKDKATEAGSVRLNLTGPLFIGGVSSNVNLHPLVTQRNGFSGCFKEFQYSSLLWTRTINLTKPTVSYNTRSCVSNVMSGFGFNKTSWVKFANMSLNTKTLDIQLDFRTSSRQGVILHLVNNNTRPGQESYLELEQVNGQLVLTYKNASGGVRSITWSAASSYMLCNMTWHTVKIKGGSAEMYLTVDQNPTMALPIAMETTLKGDLFLGGTPVLASSPPKGFTGCIKNFKIASSILDYGQASDALDVTNGCAKGDNAQQQQQSDNAFA